MKRIMILLALVGMLSFQGCTGPEGPPGPEGPAGYDGLLGSVIEIENVAFTTSNSFSIVKTFAPIFDSDMILVYRLSGTSNTGADIWSLVPETYYFPDGKRNFNYDFEFTKSSVNIFMAGNNLATVGNEFRLNQIFRIVIVPAEFANSIDKNNLNAVMKTLNLNENQIQEIKL